MYYAYISETTDYHHLEQRISKVLGDHKDSNEAEVYNVHYDSLQPIVEYLADRFDEEIKYHQSLFEKLLKDTIEKEPTVPEPIILNGAEFRKILNGEIVSTQKLDFDTMSEGEKAKYVKDVFEEFLVFAGDELLRKDFEYFVANNGTKFNKRVMWGFTKNAAKEFERKIKF